MPLTDICQSNWNENQSIIESTVSDNERYFFIMPTFRQLGRFSNSGRLEIWGVTAAGPGPGNILHIPKSKSYHLLDPVFVVHTLGNGERSILPVPAIFIKDIADRDELKDTQEGLIALSNFMGVYGSLRSLSSGVASRIIKYVAISDLSLITFQTCIDNPNVNSYIQAQEWGPTFLESYKILSLGMNLANFGIGLRLSFVNHADEVITKLRAENKVAEADELLRLKKSLQVGDEGKSLDAGVELFSGVGRFSLQQIDEYVTLATQNKSANKVMLGKYLDGGPNSYIQRAGNDYTYFDMGATKWKEAQAFIANNADEMWKINKEFIDKQKALNKEFYFSQEPWKAQSHEYLSKEAEYLINLGAKDFQKINADTWKVIW